MENKTKITLQIRDTIVSWENSYIDNNLEDLYNAFEGLLVAHTFSQEQIRRFLVEKGKELNEIYYKDETKD